MIIDTTGDAPRVIGEVDLFAARTLVHEDAIYLHESVQFHVDRLDWDERKAYVRRVDVDHYTQADVAVTLKPLDVFAEAAVAGGRRLHGEVMVASLATIYKKLKFGTNENIGWGRIHLPEIELQTTAYWLTVDGTDGWRRDELDVALVGAGRAMQAVASVLLMVDPRDLGLVTQVRAPHADAPAIHLYEPVPGGVGLAERLYALHPELLDGAAGPHRSLRLRRRVPGVHRPAARVRRDGPRPARPRPPAARAHGGTEPGPLAERRVTEASMLPSADGAVRPSATGESAARASAIAAAVPGVTLGRRLATFRTIRAVERPDPASAHGGDVLAHRLAAAVGGAVVEGPGGRVVRVDAGCSRLPIDRRRLGGLPGQPHPDRRLVCLDTETTGLGTGAGTVAWIVGIGTWDGDVLRVVQLLLPDHPDEAALLDAVTREMGPSPVLVSYNGRSFDWPLLVARYRLHGRPAPELGGHLDLLPIVRRLFRHRLGGARLRTVEEGLLGVGRHDDVEGWEIPALYLDFLRGGGAAPLARVARHNAEDIRSLGRLLVHLDARLADPAARPTAHPGDLASLAEMLRRDGRHDEALTCLDHAVEALRSAGGAAAAGPSCSAAALAPGGPPSGWPGPGAALSRIPVRVDEGPPWWSPRLRPDVGGRGAGSGAMRAPAGARRDAPVDLAAVLAARARALRRLGRHAEAAAAWEELAAVAGAAGDAAWIEVAKIREHVERDPARALAATDRAIALLARRRAAGRPDHVAEGRAARRRTRLARRVARTRSVVRTARG